MNKTKFEAFLRDRLSVLQDSEIDEIIEEYLQHIDMRVQEGASEEEAVQDFGDLNVLANEILDAYKIKKPDNVEMFANKIKDVLNVMFDFINNIVNAIMQKSPSEIISSIVEFVLVLILISVLSWFINSTARVIISMFNFRPYFITGIIRFIINILRVFISFSVSISVLYWFAKERLIKGYSDSFEQEPTAQSSFKASQSNFSSESNKNDDTVDSQMENDVVNKTQKFDDEEPVFKSKKTKPKSDKSFTRSIIDTNIKILRVIMFIVLIPMIVTAVLSGIAYVYLIYATVAGFGSVGLLLIGAGVLLIYYFIVISGINFVGGSKNEKNSNSI